MLSDKGKNKLIERKKNEKSRKMGKFNFASIKFYKSKRKYREKVFDKSESRIKSFQVERDLKHH